MTAPSNIFERAIAKVKTPQRSAPEATEVPDRRLETGVAGRVKRGDQRIGAILASQGKLKGDDIERVLELQQTRGTRFGETAVHLGLISVDDLRGAIAAQYDAPYLLPESAARISSELVVACKPFDRCAEEIGALRTQLLMRWTGGEGPEARMLAIVSPGHGEGRSYLTANLAVSFAQLGKRTLLIDADLRRPRQHEIFQVENRVGLSAVLTGRADDSAVVASPVFGPLWLLPSGGTPPNPVELLSRDTFAALLARLRRRFEVLLFDTPAAQACADAQSIAFHAGDALTIARKDHTRVADTTKLIRHLSEAGVKAVGTALNSF